MVDDDGLGILAHMLGGFWGVEEGFAWGCWVVGMVGLDGWLELGMVGMMVVTWCACRERVRLFLWGAVTVVVWELGSGEMVVGVVSFLSRLEAGGWENSIGETVLAGLEFGNGDRSLEMGIEVRLFSC
jgi:hypothetical protein